MKEYVTGMPGGYERFDYEAIFKKKEENKAVEKHVKIQLGQNLGLIMKGIKMRNKTEAVIEKEWDEFFREHRETDSEDEKLKPKESESEDVQSEDEHL